MFVTGERAHGQSALKQLLTISHASASLKYPLKWHDLHQKEVKGLASYALQQTASLLVSEREIFMDSGPVRLPSCWWPSPASIFFFP